ncbi:hypothetical protein [Candidatus Leptofilum sp.]|uniref:hypothetical protein n=1 Tax=Candidatus Leptofilum sp. TaxID=3241576 RepID=UPI003B5C28FD
MNTHLEFSIVGIPLSRPEIVDFFKSPNAKPHGQQLYIVGQRPSATAEAAWIKRISETAVLAITDLLQIDDPHNHLMQTTTDRLVPVEFLAESNFLTRDLGGWVANYFGIIGYEPPLTTDDPLLKHANTLHTYGQDIRFFGADPQQVAGRLYQETGLKIADVANAICHLHQARHSWLGSVPTLQTRKAYIDHLYLDILEGRFLASSTNPAIPSTILIDELMGQMVLVELQRRTAVANQQNQVADEIAQWQQNHRETSGLQLMLKGEYIVGRHRRSTILLAPALGIVVKQPAPEPFHEIELGARVVNGRSENWPYITEDGSLVTARGRVRLILEENLVPRISRAFNYNMQFSSLMGLTIETFVSGETIQDTVLADHSRLTAELYEEVMLHQQVCELLGIENGDWHAPNFVVRQSDQAIIHVDWGAARPLRPDEYTPEGKQARIDQVSNMAFSFKNEALAATLKRLHRELLADETRMVQLKNRASSLANRAL